MKIPPLELARTRFRDTLEIVYREGLHLRYSRAHLADKPIDEAWARNLAAVPELAERVDAFAARFGRMQDTIGERLLPRWLEALNERSGSQLDTLRRAEKLGVLSDAVEWITLRQVRNALVHEYMKDPKHFADALRQALSGVDVLVETYRRVRRHGVEKLGFDPAELSPELATK